MVKYSSTAFIGIGSNLGDSVSEVNHAITLVEELKDTALTAVSSLYLTEPMGYKYQPDYVNAVIKVETLYSPRVKSAIFPSYIISSFNAQLGGGRLSVAKIELTHILRSEPD